MRKADASLNPHSGLAVWWLVSTVVMVTVASPALAETQQHQPGNTGGQEINAIAGPDGPAVDREPNNRGSELRGVLVDRTISMAGKTFYRSFSQLAIDNPIINEATLTIVERPDARWGSQVWIMEGNRMYFRTQLSPRINEAGRTAEQAVEVVQEAIIRNRLASALPSDKDLGREELP